MNKKIASEIAIGIILLVAIVVGGIFYWQSKKAQAPAQQAVVPIAQAPATQPAAQTAATSSNIAVSTGVYSNEQYGFKITFPPEMANLEKVENNFDSAQVYNSVFDVYFAKNKDSILHGGNENVILASVFDRTKCNASNIDSAGKSFCDFHKSDNATGSWETDTKDTKFIEFWIGNQKYLISLGIAEGANDNVTKTLIGKLKIELSDETADWQIYTNANLGFEVKYPTNWFAVKDDSEKRIYFQNISQADRDKMERPFPDSLRMIWISYDPKESNESAFLAEKYTNQKKEVLTVDGTQINIYEHGLAETSELLVNAFWKSKSNQLYSADTTSGGLTTENGTKKAEMEQIQILRQILSTFKFTK
jgi:hypothetical protein